MCTRWVGEGDPFAFITLDVSAKSHACVLFSDQAPRFKFIVETMMRLYGRALYLAAEELVRMGYGKLVVLQMCGFQPGSAAPLGFGRTISLSGYPLDITVIRLKHAARVDGGDAACHRYCIDSAALLDNPGICLSADDVGANYVPDEACDSDDDEHAASE